MCIPNPGTLPSKLGAACKVTDTLSRSLQIMRIASQVLMSYVVELILLVVNEVHVVPLRVAASILPFDVIPILIGHPH